jgi:hypothetical protein
MTTEQQPTAPAPLPARRCLACNEPMDPIAFRIWGRVCSRACAREWLNEEGDA